MKIISKKDAINQGLNRYFTGKPCKHGHVSERYTNSWKCIACMEIVSKKWREDNSEYKKKYSKEYYESNKEHIKKHSKEYQRTNKEEIAIKQKEYQRTNKEKIAIKEKEYRKKNKEEIAIKQKEYHKKNKSHKNQYRKEKYKSDLQFRLKQILRSRLNTAIKLNYKSGSAVRDLGCSIEFLVKYFETLFTPEMTWDNYVSYWEIDHIKPLSKFNLENREELLQAVHYTNLQPLTVEDNKIKRNYYN